MVCQETSFSDSIREGFSTMRVDPKEIWRLSKEYGLEIAFGDWIFTCDGSGGISWGSCALGVYWVDDFNKR